MEEITATDAARNFADLLDAVEHRGERFTITRRGKAVAHLQPAARGNGAEVNALLQSHRPDPQMAEEIKAVRALLFIEDRTRG